MNDSDRYFYEVSREQAENDLEDLKDVHDQELWAGFHELLLEDPEWDKWLTILEADNKAYQMEHENDR